MPQLGRYFLVIFGVISLSVFLLFEPQPQGVVLAQQPTGSVPTVTGTPSGPVIKVDPSSDFIYVYAGPGSFDYPAIGILLANETAPALGRARDRRIGSKFIIRAFQGRGDGCMGFMLDFRPALFFPL